MCNNPARRLAAAVVVVLILAAVPLASAQDALSLKEILAKNVEASGGKAALDRINSLSFTTDGTRMVVSAAGDLKVLVGKDPVITTAVLVRGDRIRRNSFNAVSDVTGLPKTIYQTLAKLYAGLFSLARFDGKLTLAGVKTFGTEKFYHLTAREPGGPESVHFYLRTDDCSLKRLVFQGTTPAGDRSEINYDFAPFEEVEGLRLPLSWFDSQVGTRGNLTEVSGVKVNPPLDKDFFTRLEINAGTTEAGPGALKGNVLEWNSSPFGLTIVTNWLKADVGKAGFRTGDKLILSLGGTSSELVFYALPNELPPQDVLVKGARLLAPAFRGGETFAVQLIGGDTSVLSAGLKALAPISVKKAAN